jgi:hypothetical protein
MGRSSGLDKETSRASWCRTRGAVVLVAGLVVGAAILIPGGSAATGTFSAVFTPTPPSTVVGGASSTINLTITNESGPKLVSADVTAPPGFTITGTPSPMPGGSNWSATGVQLRHLNLSNGASLSVGIPVASACTPNTYTWTIAAENMPGDNVALDAATSSVTTAVSGTNCKFEFVTQPKDAGVNTTITGSIFNPAGTPVTVAVRNPAAGALDATAAGSVSLTASKNNDSFTGKGPVNLDSSGQAQFGSLQSSSTGQFITLTASGSFGSSNPSSLFNILTEVDPCTTGTPCKGHQVSSQGNTTVDANASGFASGDVLGVSVYSAADFLPPTNCGGTTTWTPLTGASGAQVVYAPAPTSTGWTITITITIDKSLIVDPSKGAAKYDVCLGAKQVAQTSCVSLPSGGFKTKSGAPAICDSATGLYWGLLPDCPNGNKKPLPGPCVQSKTKDNAGDLILTAVKQYPWDGNMHT